MNQNLYQAHKFIFKLTHLIKLINVTRIKQVNKIHIDNEEYTHVLIKFNLQV